MSELISRSDLIKAIEITKAQDGRRYLKDWYDEVIEFTKNLPGSDKELTHDELQHAAEIAGDDGCYFCALWFRDTFKINTPPLPNHDFIKASSPDKTPTNCPNCQRPVSEHWSLAMTDEEMITWKDDPNVCAVTRGEVERELGVKS